MNCCNFNQIMGTFEKVVENWKTPKELGARITPGVKRWSAGSVSTFTIYRHYVIVFW